jgi:hypothetical protein
MKNRSTDGTLSVTQLFDLSLLQCRVPKPQQREQNECLVVDCLLCKTTGGPSQSDGDGQSRQLERSLYVFAWTIVSAVRVAMSGSVGFAMVLF